MLPALKAKVRELKSLCAVNTTGDAKDCNMVACSVALQDVHASGCFRQVHGKSLCTEVGV